MKRGIKSMFIETRFYASGQVQARLIKGFYWPSIVKTNDFITHVESIGNLDNGGEYETLKAWVEARVTELDYVDYIVLDLESGSWVDIYYC